MGSEEPKLPAAPAAPPQPNWAPRPAAHVRQAIAAGLQPKAQGPAHSAQAAPHVQQAIGHGAQPKPIPPAPARAPVAAHVGAAVAQAKLPSPLDRARAIPAPLAPPIPLRAPLPNPLASGGGAERSVLQCAPRVVQLMERQLGGAADFDLEGARRAALLVETLSRAVLLQWLERLGRWRQALGVYDPRQRALDELYNIFSAQLLARDTLRPQVMTRILSTEQVRDASARSNRIHTGSRIGRTIGSSLGARGKGTTDVKRLYSFMRRYGGAGLQGLHRDPLSRVPVVWEILKKMRKDPKRLGGKRQPKFHVVAIDRRRLPPGSVLDLSDPGVLRDYMSRYSRYRKMYDTHRSEGVVAVKGNISSDAVRSMATLRDVASVGELENLLSSLVDQGAREAEPRVQGAWARIILELVDAMYRSNNCLIHAIAGAAGMDPAGLPVLTITTIRNNLQRRRGVPVGAYIPFDPDTVAIIQAGLGIHPARGVHLYTGTDFGVPTQTTAGPNPLLIYYRFHHYVPLNDAERVYESELKKRRQ